MVDVLVIVTVLVTGVAIGASAGWSLHRLKPRWCQECGMPVGRICIECRDRSRADNLRTGKDKSSSALERSR